MVNLLLGRFEHAFATQDWHPAGHASFASAHAGQQPYDTIELPYGRQVLWPDHAIAGRPMPRSIPASTSGGSRPIIRKGFRPHLDSYSAFFENDRAPPTGLEAGCASAALPALFLCGLATDFCVAWSAEDAVAPGLRGVDHRGCLQSDRRCRSPVDRPPPRRRGSGWRRWASRSFAAAATYASHPDRRASAGRPARGRRAGPNRPVAYP